MTGLTWMARLTDEEDRLALEYRASRRALYEADVEIDAAERGVLLSVALAACRIVTDTRTAGSEQRVSEASRVLLVQSESLGRRDQPIVGYRVCGHAAQPVLAVRGPIASVARRADCSLFPAELNWTAVGRSGVAGVVHSCAGPSFAESLWTVRAANRLGLAEHRDAGKPLDRLAVAVLAERHHAGDDAVAVFRGWDGPVSATRSARVRVGPAPRLSRVNSGSEGGHISPAPQTMRASEVDVPHVPRRAVRDVVVEVEHSGCVREVSVAADYWVMAPSPNLS